MISQKRFNKNLDTMSRTALAILLPQVGLKPQYEKILKLWYVDCKGKWDIANEMCLSMGTLYNLISKARKSFKDILDTQWRCLSPELKDGILYLIEVKNK